jgi:hypothetical protein
LEFVDSTKNSLFLPLKKIRTPESLPEAYYVSTKYIDCSFSQI